LGIALGELARKVCLYRAPSYLATAMVSVDSIDGGK
jgi:hypothetical protein